MRTAKSRQLLTAILNQVCLAPIQLCNYSPLPIFKKLLAGQVCQSMRMGEVKYSSGSQGVKAHKKLPLAPLCLGLLIRFASRLASLSFAFCCSFRICLRTAVSCRETLDATRLTAFCSSC